MGTEAIYSSAAADPSGQFCEKKCPSDVGWVLIMFSFFACGALLVVHLFRLRLALETNAALGYAFVYGFVVVLASLDGDLITWLPWVETDATRALAGFPDGSSITFTTWCIFLRKMPFLAWAVINVAQSGNGLSFVEVLTLSMTGASLTLSLGTKLLRRLAFANKDLNVFIGVRGDAVKRSNRSVPTGGTHLGDSTREPMISPLLEDSEVGGKIFTEVAQASGGEKGAIGEGGGFVGVANVPMSSSSGSLQAVGAVLTGSGITVLMVTNSLPVFSDIMRVAEYILAVIGSVLAVLITVGIVRVLYIAVHWYCQRKTIRTSVFEALQTDLEKHRKDAEERENALEGQVKAAEEQRRAFEAQRRHEEYVRGVVLSETGIDVETIALPLDVIKARIAELAPLMEKGTASEEESKTIERLLNMLSANPDSKKELAEKMAVFRTTEERRNAEARRVILSHVSAAARDLRSVKALEAAGVSCEVARRFTRRESLVLTVTPEDEIASIHPSVLRKYTPQMLSLLELRAVVASLPTMIKNDTATGEKRAWVDTFVDALQVMVADEVAGNLTPDKLRHPCYESIGPFNADAPLLRRSAPVKSEPSSGAAATKEAAAGGAGRVADRHAALLQAGLLRREGGAERGSLPSGRPLNSVGASSLRERKSAAAEDRGTLLANIAATAAKRVARTAARISFSRS